MQRLGIDLADIWRGTLHPRRVWELSEYLPADSALQAELAGGLHLREWGLGAQLTGHLMNLIRVADYNNVAVSGGKAKKPKLLDVPSPAAPAKRPRINLADHPLARPIGG